MDVHIVVDYGVYCAAFRMYALIIFIVRRMPIVVFEVVMRSRAR